MATAFIGFGSNLGNRIDCCDRAVTLLSLLPHSRLDSVSSLYETEPVDDGAAPGPEWFLNGVVQIETDIAPASLLDICREIERALGRDQDNRKGPRTLDLDLLLYDDRILDEPGLTLPHPRLHQRRFVLAPLVELDPDRRHPVLGRSLRDLLAQLADAPVVRLLDPQPNSRYGSRPACSPSPVAGPRA
ncbi:MAG: 2-amino-4-hydroxy-6-hydroxymethyldihydropteridine pyrophosphokinase [Nitrospira sp.]|jgi:2-amino-4-hydroxy-6-hydroxymethyldihydropteridine diphosphokinase|nr:MAG: 2-amino-4-hydroxy-6-hydroxymethyldihydropteridine pyrophosphokinase [Nitrospira sp.]